jgi:hypothetical protein
LGRHGEEFLWQLFSENQPPAGLPQIDRQAPIASGSHDRCSCCRKLDGGEPVTRIPRDPFRRTDSHTRSDFLGRQERPTTQFVACECDHCRTGTIKACAASIDQGSCGQSAT